MIKRRTPRTKRIKRTYSMKMKTQKKSKSVHYQSNTLPKIYVINLKKDKTKWKKYKTQKQKKLVSRYSACLGVDPQDKYISQFRKNEDKLQIMWNASPKKKKCTAGILTSHLGVIRKIHKLKNNFPTNGVLVIEDDAIVDYKRLKDSLKNIHKYSDSIIYFGGTLHPPDTFKNKKWYDNIDNLRKSFKKNSFNKIDPEKFRILGGHGYYFPNWEQVNDLIKIIDAKKKLRALDSEMVKLQKQKKIKYFYYPAISFLDIQDAKKGVHGGYFERNMEYY